MTQTHRSQSRVPLVSVVVPSFNHASFIEQCLDSVLKEGWGRTELLVLDDASHDDSVARISQWLTQYASAFENFDFWVHERNQGVSRTLNALLARAQGSYIVLLASDDMLIPGGIGRRVAALTAAPLAKLAVIGDCDIVDSDGTVHPISAYRALHGANMRALRSPRFLRAELLVKWSVPGPALMLRASAVETYGPDVFDGSMAAEDRDFYLRLIRDDSLIYVDYRVAHYRVHELSATSMNRIEVSHAVIAAEKRYVSQLPWHLRVQLNLVLLGHRFRNPGRVPAVVRWPVRVLYAAAFRSYRGLLSLLVTASGVQVGSLRSRHRT